MWPFRRNRFQHEQCMWRTDAERELCTELGIPPTFDYHNGVKYLTNDQLIRAVVKLKDKMSWRYDEAMREYKRLETNVGILENGLYRMEMLHKEHLKND